MAKTLLVVFLLIFVFTACQNQNTQQATPSTQGNTSSGSSGTEGNQVGNIAPNFSLDDMKGQKVDLKSFKGKKVVHVVFWSSG